MEPIPDDRSGALETYDVCESRKRRRGTRDHPARQVHSATTGQTRSRFSRDSRPFASVPACTSARPVRADSTTSCYEIVDNSVDEALAGYCDPIDVTILAGRRRARHRQRPRHPGRHAPTEGKSTVEVVLTVLHAGGKFGGGGYAVSGGLHGVGSSVVNALSSPPRGRGAAAGPRLAPVVQRRRRAAGARSSRARRATRPARRSRSGRMPGSSRPSTSTTTRCARASSRWRSSTRGCGST